MVRRLLKCWLGPVVRWLTHDEDVGAWVERDGQGAFIGFHDGWGQVWACPHSVAEAQEFTALLLHEALAHADGLPLNGHDKACLGPLERLGG